MALEPVGTWKSTLAALPPVADSSWATAFASWYAARILPIEPDSSVFVAVGFLFTFNAAIFQAQLLTLAPTTDPADGALSFANAWEASLLASVALVAPGSALLPPTPPTIFSVVTTTIIDPTSIAAGKAKILELASAPPVADANNSQFPIKFREATALLSITVSGLNSIPLPGSPTPLVAPFVPLN